MNDERPIGVFDSGVGGLTVLKSIRKLLKNEDLIYFGDTARTPYGAKSKSVIEQYSYEICTFLKSYDVKYIVVACNTASSLAIDYIRDSFSDVPIVGVIEPGVEAALEVTKIKKIGVIGTVGTIQSGAYNKVIKSKEDGVKVFSQSCPLFVPLIEEGWYGHQIMDIVIGEYLSDIKESGIDVMILGCTHYPIITNKISEYLGSNVKVIDSAKTTALLLESELRSKNLLSVRKTDGYTRFYVSNEPERFEKTGSYLLGSKIKNIQTVTW